MTIKYKNRYLSRCYLGRNLIVSGLSGKSSVL